MDSFVDDGLVLIYIIDRDVALVNYNLASFCYVYNLRDIKA